MIKCHNKQKDWVYDEDQDTAIKVMDSSIAIKGSGKGHGHSYVETAWFTIYGCYASPNKDIEDLKMTLQEIRDRIMGKNECALVVGDFNAKPPQWGMRATDTRGRVLTEWIAQLDLAILNVGDAPTFVRQDYGSILDLSLGTADIGRKIVYWEVSVKETLSDHKYIIFEVQEEKGTPKTRQQRYQGWNTRKLNTVNLQRATDEVVEDENAISAKGFSNTLRGICDKSMPKKKGVKRG
ncbi:hypothetical protein NQ314_006331 [Rhamnusium bicolor]|uniref:Endonuclease/exonuclease/phosphatase domain-containing protein n=1 Tax=Rhamnusium bicolor TaxID=1586634 RepID=A0AAV8Z620_9CUCU|nr:hypothetical protein NQ314_006331 [Rhamnusium bicolor]